MMRATRVMMSQHEALSHSGSMEDTCMRNLTWTLLAALLLLLCARPEDANAQEAVADFSIATWNINYGNADLPGIVATLEASGADLVALQEVTPEAERFLRKHLADTYPHMHFHSGERATGFAVLAARRVQLADTRYLAPVHGWFGTQIIDAEIDGVRLAIANVHLLPTLPKRGDSALDMIERFLELETLRAREMAEIVAALPDDPSVVRLVAGDFNTLTGMTTVTDLRASGFIDTFAELHAQPDAHPTWHWTIGERRWTFRLDYIFADPAIATPVESKVIPLEDASDHFLVLTRFTASNEMRAAQ